MMGTQGTWGASGATGYRKQRRRGSRGQAPIVSDHHMLEEGHQEAAIGAFLLAHEGHTQDVEVQLGAWTIYCRCRRCEDVQTYEVDNEARERALGLPPWPELKK
jgi:hypothetical protein